MLYCRRLPVQVPSQLMLATGEDDHGPIIVELSLELFVVAKTRDMKGLFGWLIFELGEDCICSKAIN